MTQIEHMKQALEALEWATGCMSFDDYDDMPEATESLENAHKAITSLRQAITTEESSAVQEPVAYMRMPKVGDRVVCIEDDDIGTVQSLTAGGSPDIKFDDGSHGTYLLREFAKLFRYADTHPQPKAEQRCEYCDGTGDVHDQTGEWRGSCVCEAAQPKAEQEPIGTAGELFTNAVLERLDFRPSTKIYIHPQPKREWVGLTDEEIKQWRPRFKFSEALVKEVEFKLKEKNT